MGNAGTLDQYLLKLSVALSRMFPSDENMVLRILSETEDHMRLAVEKNRDAGLAQSEAEHEAIQQFGSPETVAECFGRELGGVLSPRALFVRSYAHVGAFVRTLVAAAGAACLVLAAAAAILGPLTVFGMADPPPSYFLPRCTLLAPQERELGVPCTTERVGPQATVSHLWLTVGGAVILAVGAGLWGAHRTLLGRNTGGWKDQSLPARAHAVLGVLFFGLVGLFVWPISAAAIFSPAVSIQPPIMATSLGASAVVTAIVFLAYAWYARSVFALRA